MSRRSTKSTRKLLIFKRKPNVNRSFSEYFVPITLCATVITTNRKMLVFNTIQYNTEHRMEWTQWCILFLHSRSGHEWIGVTPREWEREGTHLKHKIRWTPPKKKSLPNGIGRSWLNLNMVLALLSFNTQSKWWYYGHCSVLYNTLKTELSEREKQFSSAKKLACVCLFVLKFEFLKWADFFLPFFFPKQIEFD